MWHAVVSSWIVAVRWHPSGRLDVRTKSKTLHYDGVPGAVFQQLLAAPSKGIFVNTVIKPGYWYAGSTP